MKRETVVRSLLWTIICVGLFFFVAAATLLGDCGYAADACLTTQERQRQVILVGSPLIWLIGIFFIFRGRRA